MESVEEILLYISCPSHTGIPPDTCAKPCNWFHRAKDCPKALESLKSERQMMIDRNLNLKCVKCQKKNHIKNMLFYCEKTNEFKSVTAAQFRDVLRVFAQLMIESDKEDELDFIVLLNRKLETEKWK